VAINELGQVVGYHEYSDGSHYFLWTKGWRVDLGAAYYVSAAQDFYLAPVSVNDRGQVAVTIDDEPGGAAGGPGRAVVWQIDDEGVEPPDDGGGNCVLANNWAHVRDGRAVSYSWFAWAAGTGTYLGMVTDTTALRGSAPGSWQLVDAC
jgi:probable HAF family extracellular repeat protein